MVVVVAVAVAVIAAALNGEMGEVIVEYSGAAMDDHKGSDVAVAST